MPQKWLSSGFALNAALAAKGTQQRVLTKGLLMMRAKRNDIVGSAGSFAGKHRGRAFHRFNVRPCLLLQSKYLTNPQTLKLLRGSGQGFLGWCVRGGCRNSEQERGGQAWEGKEEDLKGFSLTQGKDWLHQWVRGHHLEPSKRHWRLFPGWVSSLERSIERGRIEGADFLSNFINSRMLWDERTQRSAIPRSPTWAGIFFFFLCISIRPQSSKHRNVPSPLCSSPKTQFLDKSPVKHHHKWLPCHQKDTYYSKMSNHIYFILCLWLRSRGEAEKFKAKLKIWKLSSHSFCYSKYPVGFQRHFNWLQQVLLWALMCLKTPLKLFLFTNSFPFT